MHVHTVHVWYAYMYVYVRTCITCTTYVHFLNSLINVHMYDTYIIIHTCMHICFVITCTYSSVTCTCHVYVQIFYVQSF